VAEGFEEKARASPGLKRRRERKYVKEGLVAERSNIPIIQLVGGMGAEFVSMKASQLVGKHSTPNDEGGNKR